MVSLGPCPRGVRFAFELCAIRVCEGDVILTPVGWMSRMHVSLSIFLLEAYAGELA